MGRLLLTVVELLAVWERGQRFIGRHVLEHLFGVFARGDIFGDASDAVALPALMARREGAVMYPAYRAVWTNNAILFVVGAGEPTGGGADSFAVVGMYR